MLPPVSPKLSPPSPWKPGFAEPIQAPSHLHVYQRAFTAQWPQQVLSNGPIVLQNHPKSELPASCSLAVSSAVETPVSFLGLLKPSLPTYGNCAPATCWDVHLWGKARIFSMAESLDATSSFIWHSSVVLMAAFHFTEERLDCHMDGRMRNTCFLPSLFINLKIPQS